ncbi:MAG: FlgD immunoglobulin-like domain containing protein, partial [candidate division WOR-3 bacterium]
AYTERIQARYLNADGTWSNGQTIYSASGQGSFGPVAIATASDEENPCCYAAFLYHNGSGNRFLIVAKFDGDSVRTDTVATGDNLGDPAIAVEPGENGDYLHLVWTDDGEVKYTMSQSRISATNWDFGFPSDWKGVVNLSNSQTPSVHPVIAADQSRIVVSWAEGVIPEVLARYRSTQDEYNIWLGPFNLSNTQDYISDYPTIALSDTCVIAWQEQGQNEEYDIMASVEFADAFNINDNQTPSTYPHILFQKKVSGDSTIPYLHCIYSEAPSQNYYEVGYHKLNLKQTGGGGQQGGEFTYLEPRLYQCAPNPFSKRTSIRFQIGQKGNVNLKVYDIQGRLVRTLISGEQKPGIYTVVWDGKDGHNRQVPNGVYFYRLDAPGITDTKKTVLMR